MAIETRSCACGCGRTFEVDTSRRGRPRLYWDKACTKRAERDRRTNAVWAPAIAEPIHLRIPDTRQQLESAILELAVLAGSLRRISIETTSPALAAGAERTYLGITKLLDENFPGWNS